MQARKIFFKYLHFNMPVLFCQFIFILTLTSHTVHKKCAKKRAKNTKTNYQSFAGWQHIIYDNFAYLFTIYEIIKSK